MDSKRDSVIKLYLDGKSQKAIVKALSHLNVNKSFVSRTIARYRDTGSVARREGSGRTRTVTSEEMIQKVKELIQRNPGLSGRQMAQEMNISFQSMQRILKHDLKLKPYKTQQIHELPATHKKDTLDRASGQLPNSAFSDESPSVLERYANKQND